jgi:hypothetical protein
MTPTESILKSANETGCVADLSGRTLTIRRLNALDKLRLLKAAGPILSDNQAWLGVAMLAASVSEIDGIPVPMPTSENQIESLVARLGEAGLDAIATSLAPSDQATGPSTGN